MTRATAVRAFLALVVLVVSGWLVATRPARLGLDLRGGTQIVLQTRDGDQSKADAATTDQAMEVLRRRVDELGVAEPSLVRSGDRRIIVELPGVTDPREAAEVIGRTAQLTFRPVLGPAASPTATPATGELVRPDERGNPLRLGPAALSGRQIDGAQAGVQPPGGWEVAVEFAGDGARDWQRLTAAAACSPVGDPARRVAILLDDEVISSPEVSPEATCEVGFAGAAMRITGSFGAAEARDLALLIRAGALPVPVDIIQQQVVGPTLGRQAIEASAQAALIGALLTIAFIVAVYRVVGALAAVALVAYGLISYAALLAIGATLTLPGLAGFVLAIGMAVDANVLVFERAREEYGGRPTLRSAIRGGFARAWSAIIDSNVTTLVAAALLFLLASGPVRGFGITLGIGVLASMFTALVLTRLPAEALLHRRWLVLRPRWSGIAHAGRVRRAIESRGPDLMGRRRLWLAVSAAAVLLALGGVATRGLNLGVEFTGGRMVEYTTSRPLSTDAARAAVAAAGVDRAVVTQVGQGNVSVRAGTFDDATEQRVRDSLGTAGGGDVEPVRDDKVGPSLGAELRDKALLALAIALGAQMAYLSVRFQWRWSAAAVLAMVHDVVILIGVFAWLGKPVDGVFLAAVLTVVGYSVNDSVVVFDRIRELVRGQRKISPKLRVPFPRLANTACLQTVPRTVNTGLGAVFILAALAILGGASLVDFAVALLVGIVVGTYSSVFLATPLAITFRSR
ncbi:protein translocase subunit SecD [Actinoplanes auranticolor]|uniref:Multifunctional fusion protein n=1 Tax=Actinoplanes auranticolor TaxID=47988 RepID=A0A919SAL8_9ACTN|nr:protein translocase subunit SecD [Actinoplanes auranticolor]GIM68057.1 protein translocase subunit SecDF [Actinoplanes auranticolor]